MTRTVARAALPIGWVLGNCLVCSPLSDLTSSHSQTWQDPGLQQTDPRAAAAAKEAAGRMLLVDAVPDQGLIDS